MESAAASWTRSVSVHRSALLRGTFDWLEIEAVCDNMCVSKQTSIHTCGEGDSRAIRDWRRVDTIAIDCRCGIAIGLSKETGVGVAISERLGCFGRCEEKRMMWSSGRYCLSFGKQN